MTGARSPLREQNPAYRVCTLPRASFRMARAPFFNRTHRPSRNLPPGQSPLPESSSQRNPSLRPSSRRTTSAGTIARHLEVLSETICLPVHRPAPPFSYPELPASEGIPIYALHQNGTFQYRFNTISIIFRYEI